MKKIEEIKAIEAKMLDIATKSKIPMFKNKEKFLVESYMEFYEKHEELKYNIFGFSTYLAGVIDTIDPKSRLNEGFRSDKTHH